MWMRLGRGVGIGIAIAFVSVACTPAPVPARPAPIETSTLESAPPLQLPANHGPFGDGPWVGRWKARTHRYSHGCGDERTVDILALSAGESAQDRSYIPVAIGWRKVTRDAMPEPHFLAQRDEVPAAARESECVSVSGSVVEYAYEGFFGIPATAVFASHIEPVACP